MNVNISKKVFNSCYLKYLDDDSRYLIFYGGAGSGKSYFIGERYLYRIMKNPRMNLMCVRQVGNTNRDSTFALFKQIISKWGVGKLFKTNESDMRITCTNGACIIFKGLDDSEKLKSVTFPNGELTDVWVEEASEVDEADFNQLDIRLRGKGTKKQIVVSFNPIDINHWLKKRFFDNKADNAKISHTTYKDNQFLNEEDGKLLESYRKTDPYYYDVYCLGHWGVYGSSIFAKDLINQRLTELRDKPYKVVRFSYVYDGFALKDIKCDEDESGHIKIYKDPEKGHPYVIGGDTSGEGSDFFTAQVIDNYTGEQVAVLKNQFDEDVYARDVYCLGRHYNNALISIEANFSSYPIKELQRINYPYQFVRTVEDSYTGKPKPSFGFKTTSMTRPIILAGLVEIVREKVNLLNDIDTLQEMLTFVRNEKGRPEAQKGAHDDLVMALAITYYSRTQQSTEIQVPEAEMVVWREALIEDYYNSDAEMKEMMIKKFGRPSNL